MFKIRKAIKDFKDDFVLEPNAVSSTGSLRSDTPSSGTTSDDVSRYSASLNRSLRNTANGDDLPIIPAEHSDSSNFNEAVSPLLQKRSLFQSLQHNTSLVSSNKPLPLIESSSYQEQSKLLDLTPISRSPITSTSSDSFAPSIDILPPDTPRIALSSISETRTSSSSDPSDSSVEYILLHAIPSATPSKQVVSEPLQQHYFTTKTLLSDPRPKKVETDFALLASGLQVLKGAHYDSVNEFGQPELGKRPKSPVDLPSNASSFKTTNGNAVSSTSVARKILKSTALSSSEADDAPMESKQSSVTQTSQEFIEAPYVDSLIQTTTLTAINDDDDDDQNTLETKKRLDPTRITQPLPLTANKLLEKRPNPLFKREGSVPGEFPLDGPSTSSSVQSLSMKLATSTFPDNNPTSKENNADDRMETRRKPSSTSLSPPALATPSATPTAISTEVPETVEQIKTQRRPKPFQSLKPIDKSSDSISANSSSALSPDDLLARKMEELGKIRRMEARSAQSKTSHKVTPQRPLQPIHTIASPKAELRPHMYQEDSSSDVTALLGAAYIERQYELQTQLDKAFAELREVRDENKHLTDENQSQHHTISQLKIELYKVKHVQDDSSVQIENQLRDVIASLTAFGKEKKGWQDKLDSMYNKLSAAERQVRCLDHLTSHRLELCQDAAYGQQPKRGLFSSVSASTDVVGAMGALNEEISQTCAQLAKNLKRMNIHSDRYKLQAQTVLGDRLTMMMEDHATMTKSGYNTLLMQAVLEVFMVQWCFSIIQAFYPEHLSFADQLVRLSARTTKTSESSAICTKQIPIVQPSTPHTDKVKFNEWVTYIIKELDFILMGAGVKMKTLHVHLFHTKTLALVKLAYNLRIAMTTQDIHGGLEAVIVLPDMPFQENWMLDAHADLKKGDADQSFVVGTSGIGLRRRVLERVDGHCQSRMDMEFKPKVILA